MARMGYFWVDTHGKVMMMMMMMIMMMINNDDVKVCEQRGVFRVNCVDCLDRTNVVQVNTGLSLASNTDF